jgi:DNA-binding XRE family transcriptional regulator
MSAAEWLSRAEAAEAVGYTERALRAVMATGVVPRQPGPRPPGRTGPRIIEYVHMPSLLAEKARRGDRGRHKPRPSVMKHSATKLGSALQGWRLAKGWNQTDAAKAIGTSKDTLSHWELGLRVPTVRYAVKLCELYDLGYKERWAVIEAIAWKQEQ